MEQRMMKAAVLAGPRQIEIKEEPILGTVTSKKVTV